MSSTRIRSTILTTVLPRDALGNLVGSPSDGGTVKYVTTPDESFDEPAAIADSGGVVGTRSVGRSSRKRLLILCGLLLGGAVLWAQLLPSSWVTQSPGPVVTIELGSESSYAFTTVSIDRLAWWEASVKHISDSEELVRSFPLSGQLKEAAVAGSDAAMVEAQHLGWALAAGLADLSLDEEVSPVAVGAVTSGSPADVAGLLPGDYLLALNGVDLSTTLVGHSVVRLTTDGTYAFSVVRNDEELIVSFGVPKYAASMEDLGVYAIDSDTFPRPANTAAVGAVGGPSGGLLFALAHLDLLVDEDLSGGMFVTGTGALRTDGAVRPVGGVHLKATAAKSAGADVFFVPAAEASEADVDGLTVVGVGHWTEAVDWLCEQGHAPAFCSHR